MDIADHIERAVIVAAIVPERGSLDGRDLSILGSLDRKDVAEALLAEARRIASIATAGGERRGDRSSGQDERGFARGRSFRKG